MSRKVLVEGTFEQMSTVKKSQPSWKELYKLALLEPERTKVPSRIAEARAAISQQLSDLASSPSCDEYAALKDAQKFLRLVEKEEAASKV